jgi:hypothetical protein
VRYHHPILAYLTLAEVVAGAALTGAAFVGLGLALLAGVQQHPAHMAAAQPVEE